LFQFFALPQEVEEELEILARTRDFAIWTFPDDSFSGPLTRLRSLAEAWTTSVWIGRVPVHAAIGSAVEASHSEGLARVVPPIANLSRKELLLGELMTPFTNPPAGSPYRILKRTIEKLLVTRTVAFSDLAPTGRTVPGPKCSRGAMAQFADGWRLGQAGVKYVYYRPPTE
jgi:hypothetical protein